MINKNSLQNVLIRPRITEKATWLVEKENTYVFEVATDASKPVIAKYIRSMYSVTPLRVTIVNSPAKKTFVRGKVGSKSAVKKAYVTLKKGDKIEFA